MSCPHKTQCELFPLFRLKASLRTWQIRYCDAEDDFRECVRYQATERGETPSPELLPNGRRLPVLKTN